jgi:hypothetical protein
MCKYQTPTGSLLIQAQRTVYFTKLCVSGDRKYGVPNLHPFFVKEMSVKQFGFTLTARDMSVEGAKDADLQDIR